MSSSIRRRLDRLEGGGTRCPECGYHPGEEPEECVYVFRWLGGAPDDVEVRDVSVISSDGTGVSRAPEEEPEPTPPCEVCGRVFETVIEWPVGLRLTADEPEVPDYPPERWPQEGEG